MNEETFTIWKSYPTVFGFFIGCSVVDQRGWDGWFIGRIEVLAISSWKFFQMSVAGRETCFCFEYDHREFLLQDERLSGGKMGRCFNIYVKDTVRWCSESLCKMRIRWNSSKDFDAQFSKVEDDGEVKCRSETSITNFLTKRTRELRQEQWLLWLRVVGDYVALEEEKKFAISGKQMVSIREETNAAPGRTGMSVQKPTPKTAPPSEPPTRRSRSASRKRRLRGRSLSGKTIRQPCRDLLEGTCTKLHSIGILPNVNPKKKIKIGMRFRCRVLIPALDVWRITKQKAEKGDD